MANAAKKNEKAVEVLTTTDMLEILGAVVKTEDPDAVAREIAGRILSATSIDDVFNVGSELPSSEAILNVPIEVQDVRFNKSGVEGGLGFYAVLDYAVIDGEDAGSIGTAAIGGTNPMAQLFKLNHMGVLKGMRLVLKQSSKASSRGYYPQFFQPVQ